MFMIFQRVTLLFTLIIAATSLQAQKRDGLYQPGAAAGVWEFGPKGASINQNGVSLYMGCDSAARPIAWLIGYNRSDAARISFSVDGRTFDQFNFVRVGPAGSLYSSLYAEVFWDGGLVQALSGGRSLSISDGEQGIALLPLRGSRAALETLWQRCNLAGQSFSY